MADGRATTRGTSAREGRGSGAYEVWLVAMGLGAVGASTGCR
jgi:hypothetical protein